MKWRVVIHSFASFTAISFVLCVGFGLIAPPAFHPPRLLETFITGFGWLSLGSFVLGLIATARYGAFMLSAVMVNGARRNGVVYGA